jgi:hypothetical protein
VGRPTIAYLNECRQLHREGRMKSKGKWKAPKQAPPEKPRVGERVSRSYAVLLGACLNNQKLDLDRRRKFLVDTKRALNRQLKLT